MAEWDRLEERLKELGESASWVAEEPLDPAIVRELGAGRRTRRWAVSVVAAVVMMISGAAGVYALTIQRQTPLPAGLPSHSPSVQYVENDVDGPTGNAAEPSARGSLMPTVSAPRHWPRSTPLPYATAEPSTPDPGSVTPTPTPTPTPSEPTDTPTEPPSPTMTIEPPPTSVPEPSGGSQS